jgi:hypothetical protein
MLLHGHRKARGLMSGEHFTVDRNRIQAWATGKSFRRQDGCGDGDGHDLPSPDAHLRKEGNRGESKLNYPRAREASPQLRRKAQSPCHSTSLPPT